MDNHALVLHSTAPVVRKRVNGPDRKVGLIVTGKVLGTDFENLITQTTGMNFTTYMPHGDDTHTQPANLAEVRQALASNHVPRMLLNGDPSPDHSWEHAWRSTEGHFIGAVDIEATSGDVLRMLFTQRKDSLETTLQTFQQSIIVVLVVAGLLVLPIGIFFFNRTISRPVESWWNAPTNCAKGISPT